MPQLENVTTKSANQIWASPDGQRKIYEVVMEWDGKQVKAKTFSDAIASVGWSGTVESYEKDGKYGSETYVKQPPKEGGYAGGYSGGPSAKAAGSAPGKFQADPFTMYLSYAKDLAVASVHEGKFDTDIYAELLDAVGAGGHQLYEGRPGASPAPAPKADTALADINAIFPDGEEQEELPWPKK